MTLRKLFIFFALLGLVLSLNAVIVSESTAQVEMQYHRVNYGETIYYIADLYDVPAEVILEENNLTQAYQLYVGLVLIIPMHKQHQMPFVKIPDDTSDDDSIIHTPASTCAQYHIVSTGETLSGIAWYHGVSIQKVMQLNNWYNQDFVYVGQTLCVAEAAYSDTSGTSTTTSSDYHVVVYGESLTSISERYGVDFWDLVEINDLSDADFIWAGQRLKIPGYTRTEETAMAQTYTSETTVHVDEDVEVTVAVVEIEEMTEIAAETDVADADVSEATDETSLAEADEAILTVPVDQEPITVIVNGEQVWVSEEIYNEPEQLEKTTLVVKTTGDEAKNVRIISENGYLLDARTEFDKVAKMFLLQLRDIPADTYTVSIEDPYVPSKKMEATVAEGYVIELLFDKEVITEEQSEPTPGGWMLLAWHNPSQSGERLGAWSNLLVRGPAGGYLVHLEADAGGFETKCLTGGKGWNACDFAGLGPGLYNITIEDSDLVVQTWLDGSVNAEINITNQIISQVAEEAALLESSEEGEASEDTEVSEETKATE